MIIDRLPCLGELLSRCLKLHPIFGEWNISKMPVVPKVTNHVTYIFLSSTRHLYLAQEIASCTTASFREDLQPKSYYLSSWTRKSGASWSNFLGTIQYPYRRGRTNHFDATPFHSFRRTPIRAANQDPLRLPRRQTTMISLVCTTPQSVALKSSHLAEVEYEIDPSFGVDIRCFG